MEKGASTHAMQAWHIDNMHATHRYAHTHNMFPSNMHPFNSSLTNIKCAIYGISHRWCNACVATEGIISVDSSDSDFLETFLVDILGVDFLSLDFLSDFYIIWYAKHG